MGHLRNSRSPIKRQPLKRGQLSRGVYINKKGPLTTLWEEFRGKKLIRDRNGDGVIVCQDWKLGLPACGETSDSPDLHHIVGREAQPALYFVDSNLVWLVRGCHDAAHSQNTSSTSAEAEDDSERQVEERPRPPRPEKAQTASSGSLPSVQGRLGEDYHRKSGRTVFSSIQHRNAEVLDRKKEGVL